MGLIVGHLSKRWIYPLVHSRSPRTTLAVIPSNETVVTVSEKQIVRIVTNVRIIRIVRIITISKC